jgi:hypothetical protein
VSDTQARLDAIRARLADATMADDLAVEYFEDVPWLAAELERVTAALRKTEDDALSLLDQHISTEVRQETGLRIIERIQARDAALAGGARAAQIAPSTASLQREGTGDGGARAAQKPPLCPSDPDPVDTSSWETMHPQRFRGARAAQENQ